LQQAIDIHRINLPVIDKWIEARVLKELGFDDDVLVGMICNKIREEPLNVKALIVDLSMFLGNEAKLKFVTDLWTLFLEAQQSPDGLPQSLVDLKKKELESKAQTSQKKPLPSSESQSSRARSKSPPRRQPRRRRSRSPKRRNRSRSR